jgi:hypothetical protein
MSRLLLLVHSTVQCQFTLPSHRPAFDIGASYIHKRAGKADICRNTDSISANMLRVVATKHRMVSVNQYCRRLFIN